MEKSQQAKGKCLRLVAAGSRSSQSSLEYLVIVALTFAIIVPTAYLFFSYTRQSGEEITDAQIIQVGRNIVDAAETIYYSGQGSKTVIDLNIPDNSKSAVIIDGKELVFNMSSNNGISEIVFLSKVNLTTNSFCEINVCNLPLLAQSGFKKVKIEAIKKDSINIDVI